jgi:hypothetical protein
LEYKSTFVDPILSGIEWRSLRTWITGEAQTETEDGGNIVVLLGPAGFGKTTISRELAIECARNHLRNGSNPIPILISLDQYRSKRNWDELLAAFSDRMNIPEITSNALKYYIDNDYAIVFIDGLDELAERGGIDAATETLIQLQNATNEGRLLITARDSYANAFLRGSNKDNTIYARILGVAEADRKNLLFGEYEEGVIATTIEILDQFSGAQVGLKSNPLLLVLLAQQVSKMSLREARRQFLEIVNPYYLLDKVIESIHSRDEQRQKLNISVNDYVKLFGHLAYVAFSEGRTSSEESALIVPDGTTWLGIWIEEKLQRITDLDSRRLSSVRLQESLKSHHLLEVGESIKFRHVMFRNICLSKYFIDKIKQGASFAMISWKIDREITENPEILHSAPHSTPVKRLDEVGAARNVDVNYFKHSNS